MNQGNPLYTIVLVDSRGVIDFRNKNAIQRHINYANRVRQFRPNTQFIIISASEFSNSTYNQENFNHFFVKSNKRFSAVYIFRAIRIILKSRANRTILIAGDPWESTFISNLISILLKLFFRIRAPIQIQIHADVMDLNWRKLKLINGIRYLMLNYSLGLAAQIRVVSDNIKNEIVTKRFATAENILVSPMEINLPSNSTTLYFRNRPRSIGFAGRFHLDRGVKDFVEYVRNVDPNVNNLDIVLAGDGPSFDFLFSELSEIVHPSHLRYLGDLTSPHMQIFWREVGVYVSLAKTESYGLSIREAAFLGIPVLGAKSRGFNDLMQVGVPWICEVESFVDPIAQRNQLELLLSIQTDNSVQNLIRNQSESNINVLIQSWINLLNDDTSG